VTRAERTLVTNRRATVTTVFGVSAASWAMLMAVSPLLQVREIRRRRSSAGISIGYFAVLLVGFALWVAYGLARHDLPLVLPNSLALLVTTFTIVVALRHRP
jgi:MtN3 and saliva related transmembrane protein